jgi:hypothetical protein
VDLKFVKKLDGWNGLGELYLLGEQYIVISTVTEEQRPTDPMRQMWMEMTEVLSKFTELETLPAHGEETIAVNADADGRVAEFHPHLAMATVRAAVRRSSGNYRTRSRHADQGQSRHHH